MSDTPKKPERTSGISHFFAALQYSQAGIRRLWRESAFRQEVAGGALALAVLIGFGASVGQVIGFCVLWLVLAAVEALNTALEELVDHLSPEWSAFARDAKDLGSLAVAFVIGANTLYVLWVILI
ncbi:MAG: diacylglycerol kinase [Rhodobacteraceae bacterium]|nr:diacylglycerol kinase [Paracoccaceae bacterium]MCF8514708.1 diacylglycerol kinase [Paracoccaceae bacterium]MCF8518751.1 diacylglycerol kinase [Paracoccaceae bacterium]